MYVNSGALGMRHKMFRLGPGPSFILLIEL
jgi:hypothetical protein